MAMNPETGAWNYKISFNIKIPLYLSAGGPRLMAPQLINFKVVVRGKPISLDRIKRHHAQFQLFQDDKSVTISL